MGSPVCRDGTDLGFSDYNSGLVEPEVGRQMVHENINRAFELDPDFPDAYFLSGIISTWTDWDWEKGEKAFLKALAINPNDVMSRIYYAHLLICLQRPDEALTQGQLAVELDPLNPLHPGIILWCFTIHRSIPKSPGVCRKGQSHQAGFRQCPNETGTDRPGRGMMKLLNIEKQS